MKKNFLPTIGWFGSKLLVWVLGALLVATLLVGPVQGGGPLFADGDKPKLGTGG
ncbi:hypothetical protein [Meiothermus sp.]|uniref:hypothetical protein n=1 Tax=Meiothermus sp. TaxID=1955249 RepID=UPI002627F273|nr:hypothetical protein [Meiothermus sp.]